MTDDLIKVNTAIISTYEKSGIKYLASELVKINPGIKIISSGGTFREIEKAAPKNVVQASDYTGFPEMPSGLVKTLHPLIHCGILGGMDDRDYMEQHRIRKIDMVAVNLYPFQQASSKSGKIEDARNKIDIGGVSLIEAGCKNFLRVAVITEPTDYEGILSLMRGNNGCTSLAARHLLAKKGFSHISNYMDSIDKYFQATTIGKVRKEYLD
ncbi:hypothetical protein HYY72_03465 [Candidatus Woesearchaeota archaeon]|nr:hypothetical protein [Candidatus Woesearchaeota archaeon]